MITQIDIIAAIADHLGLSPQDIDRQASFEEDLNLSPIEISDLISFLNQKFDVYLPNEDLTDIKTVEDLVMLIEDNLI
ncbi:MAG: Uncharacterized protein CEO21_277 [Microgenomates group bacterium Gr01-1014_80]|nr:MAG: Uncharacterized protein CEO21_277 [Microgenomates group bacterium Gr01-1014_80]